MGYADVSNSLAWVNFQYDITRLKSAAEADMTRRLEELRALTSTPPAASEGDLQHLNHYERIFNPPLLHPVLVPHCS